MNVDLIVFNASQLVTCISGGKPKKGAAMSELGIVENGAVAVADEKIISVGSTENILRDFQSANVIDAGRKVVCPGFVECHTHLIYAGNRLDEFELKIKGADYLEILKSGGGILSTVKATREASLENLIEDARKRLDKMLALGVTTCEIKTGYGLNTASEMKMLTAILELNKTHPVDLIPTLLAAHAIPIADFKMRNADFSDTQIADIYTDLICREMLPKLKELILTPHSALFTPHFFVDVFCEKNAFSLEQSRKILEAAKLYGFKLKAHVDEFTNLGGARMAIELGATSIDHLDTISDEEIKLLADSETIGVVTPTVNFNLGAKDFADARNMIDAGCAIAVSTDYNPGSAPCPSLPNAMAIACRYQKLLPAETLNAATINAAFAAGLGDKTGSIETGKKADLLILETDDYRQLSYEFGGNLIGSVIKNGKIILT